MDDHNVDDSVDNPFVPDVRAPEMDRDNPETPLDPYTPFVPPPSPVPWWYTIPWGRVLIVAGIAAAALVVVLLLAALISAIRGAAPAAVDVDPPEQTVRYFYEALNREDYTAAIKYVDPDATVLPNALPLVDVVKRKIAEAAKSAFGSDIRLKLQFSDLIYEVVEPKPEEKRPDEAVVKAHGRVHVSDANTGTGIYIPYEATHTLKRRQGHWYILSN
jgi:hypothetical protein